MANTQRAPLSPVPAPETAGLGGIPGLGGATPNLLGELKSEVAGEAAPLLTYILKHSKVLVGVLLALVFTIIGYGGWQWYSEKSLREAQIALGRILVNADSAARVSALEAFLGQAPKALRDGILLEIAGSALAANDLTKAADAYARMSGADPDGAMGLAAAVNQADLALRLGKPDAALATLDTISGKAPEAMKNALTERRATALEQAGRFAEALSTYQTLLTAMNTGKQTVDSDFIRFKIRNLQTKTGK